MKSSNLQRSNIIIVVLIAVTMILTAVLPSLATENPAAVQGDPQPQAQGQSGKVTLCHATGSASNPYVEITVSSDAATESGGHANHVDDIIPAPAEGCPGAINQPIVCHATGNGTVPYEAVAVSDAVAAAEHDAHVDDIIPAPLEGCPDVLWPGRTDGPNKVTLCHATGSASNPYVAITVSFNAATQGHGHANHVDDIIPAPVKGCPSIINQPIPAVTSVATPGTVTVCHATGNGTAPYEAVAASDAVAAAEHDAHLNDIIPAPLEGCPNVLWLSPVDGPSKIDICHATGSASNPYVVISVSYNAATEGHGHANHRDDIIPAPAEGCPVVLWAGGFNPLLPTVPAPAALTPISVASPACVDWFVYSTNITGDWEIYRLGVLPENPDADANLTKGAGQNISDIAPSLSPDRRWLTFSSNRTGNWEVYVGSTDGTVQQRVTQTRAQNTNPVWSPTGQYIAFESNRDGTWGLYMVDVTTGVETRLTFDTANYINPSWSPDGTRLLFQSDRNGGVWQIYELDVASTSYQLRSDGQGDDFDPSYSADGSRIVFRSLRDVNSVIYAMNGDGTGMTRISDPAARALNPVWSPDNSLIVYQANPGGDMEIYVYEVATGRTRQVTDNLVDDYAPTWLCNSPTLVFTSDVDGNPNIFSTSALPMEAASVVVQDQAARMTTDVAMDRYPVGSPGESHASLVGDR